MCVVGVRPVVDAVALSDSFFFPFVLCDRGVRYVPRRRSGIVLMLQTQSNMMENIGKMIEQQSLGEPLSEPVDSPGGSTHVRPEIATAGVLAVRSMLSSDHPHQSQQQQSRMSLESLARQPAIAVQAVRQQTLVDNRRQQPIHTQIITRIDHQQNHVIKEEHEHQVQHHHHQHHHHPHHSGNVGEASVEVGVVVGEDITVEEVESVDLEDQVVKQQDGLSVIVQPQDDSEHDSELLSPGKLSPTSAISVSVASMIDASDFRALQPEPTYQTLTSVNGRMSPPGFSPTSSYATLTPLQPLPPISTMSDKFAYGHASNVSGSFTVMQNNGLGLGIGLGVNVNSGYTYDKISSMGMTPPHNYSSPNNTLGSIGIQQQPSPISPQSSYSQNGLPSPQKSMSPNSYDSPYGTQRDLVGRSSMQQHSPTLSPPSTSLHSPGNSIVTNFGAAGTMNGLTTIAQHSAIVQTHTHHTPPSLVQIAHPQREAVVVSSPSPPVLTIQQQPATQQLTHQQQMTTKNVSPNHSSVVTGVGSGATGNGGLVSSNGNSLNVTADVEEINTKDLAQRISAELKRYSIPQAIFAQRVLCRSQGTLSDLLRNPKPWSKLKSGRETFRRMWKWLQEPEFQRMSALRLAGELLFIHARTINTLIWFYIIHNYKYTVALVVSYITYLNLLRQFLFFVIKIYLPKCKNNFLK